MFTARYELNIHTILAVPWLTRLVAGLAPRTPGLDPASVRFVVARVALGQVFPASISAYPCQPSTSVQAAHWLLQYRWTQSDLTPGIKNIVTSEIRKLLR